MSTAAVHITTSQEKAQFGEQTCLKRRPKKKKKKRNSECHGNVRWKWTCTQYKKKSLSKDNYRKEKQLKSHLQPERHGPKKDTKSNNIKKVEAESFLDENDLQWRH